MLKTVVLLKAITLSSTIISHHQPNVALFRRTISLNVPSVTAMLILAELYIPLLLLVLHLSDYYLNTSAL